MAPIRSLPREGRAHIVQQVLARTDELGQQTVVKFLVELRAQQKMPGLERDHPNGDIGQRVAKERRQQSRKDIALQQARTNGRH